MKLVIMTTAREPSYVAQTVASVLASDWRGRITVSTDPLGKGQLRHLLHHDRIDLDVWTPEEWKRVDGSRVHRKAGMHYCRCLDMIAQDPEGGIVLEDDVVVRDDLLQETRQLAMRARAGLRDDNFMILLYSSRDPERLNVRGRIGGMSPRLFFGTQAIYWTSQAAKEMSPYLWDHAVERDELVYDLLIRQHCIQQPTPTMMLPHESVVQHVGDKTTGMGQFHSSPTFSSAASPHKHECMLTAGIGRRWPERAMRVADRLRQLHPEHRVIALTELPEWLPCKLPSISWLKAFSWDLVPSWCDTIVWVDADVIPMRPITPLPEGDFCAVPDAKVSVPFAWRAMSALDQDKTYYNAGIWIARRRSRPVFEALKQFLVSGAWGVQPFFEQSFLNLLLQIMPLHVTDLPRQYNWMSAFGPVPDDVRLIHRAGSHASLAGWWDKADAVFKAGDHNETPPPLIKPNRRPSIKPDRRSQARPRRLESHAEKPLSKPKPKGR